MRQLQKSDSKVKKMFKTLDVNAIIMIKEPQMGNAYSFFWEHRWNSQMRKLIVTCANNVRQYLPNTLSFTDIMCMLFLKVVFRCSFSFNSSSWKTTTKMLGSGSGSRANFDKKLCVTKVALLMEFWPKENSAITGCSFNIVFFRRF